MNLKHFLPVALCAGVSVACQVEELKVPAEELYAREFIKEFGIVDSQQDWNLATHVTATTDSRSLNGASTIYIYDRMPGADGCQLAAKFSASTSTFSFDIAKANTRAYVMGVSSEGKTVFASYLPIKNGNLEITSSGTARAASDLPASSIKLQQIEKGSSWGNGIGYFCFNSYKQQGMPSCNYEYWHQIKGYELSADNLSPILDVFDLYGMHTGDFGSAYLTGTFSDTNDGRPCSDLAAIAGDKGVFHEGIVDGKCNLNRHGEKLHPENGVVYTSDGGEITLEYVYGAGIFDNSFGYFYYEDGATYEEIMAAPKFLLMLDASPWSNTMRAEADSDEYSIFENIGGKGMDGQTGATIGEIRYKEGIDNYSGMRPANDIEDYESATGNGSMTDEEAKAAKNVKYKPSFHKLVYYPLDENNKPIESQASYDFPKGMKIGFFVVCQGHQKIAQQGNVTNLTNGATSNVPGADFRFSLPWMNQLLGCYYQSQASHATTPFDKVPFTYKNVNITDYTPHMTFVTYLWNGQTVMGVEDGTYHDNDHDMNDILFFVRGVDNNQEEFETYPLAQSWIIACEDLGVTDDFDFNDVVFGVSHVATDEATQEVHVKALAAGGTLPVNLYYNGEKVGDFSCWNEWFGVSETDHIINAGSQSDHTGLDGAEIKLNVDGKFSLSSEMFREGAETPMGGFSLKVENDVEHTSHWVRPPGTTGTDAIAPQMILVPGTWAWPTERTHICEAYDGVGGSHPGFKDWCNNHDHNSWVLYPANSTLVVKHNWKPRVTIE